MSVDLVAIGLAYQDLLLSVPRLPRSDESLPLSGLEFQGGGKVATAAVTAVRLGRSAAFVGPLGEDLFGQQILAGLRQEGVDVSHVQTKPGRTSPFSAVLVEDGGARSILWNDGGPAEFTLTDALHERIATARYLLLCEPYPAALAAAAFARSAGVPVVLDADYHSPDVEGLLPLADICIASSAFAAAVAPGDPPEAALERLPSPVSLITLGEGGVVGRTQTGTFRLPAFPVEAVDTTGAGDVFHGAYIAGLCYGYDHRLATIYASAVAALKCQTPGGRRGIPNHQQTIAFLTQHQIPEV
ncbi:MAG: carbohydrate kinase family protein [Bacillota bacterium]